MSIFRSGAHKSGAPRRTTVVTDDEVQLRAMERRGEAGSPVRCVHHLYFRDAVSAREAARRVAARGWTLDWLSAQPEPFQGWLLRARRDVVVSRGLAAEARAFFEAIAAETGGSYQGWDVRRIGKHALAS